MTTVLILTSRRDTEDPWQYLRATLEQVLAEDVTGVDFGIVCDGDYDGPVVPKGWQLFTHQAPVHTSGIKGNKLAYWELLRVAWNAGTDVVALEDDLELCRNALRRMVAFQIPQDLHLVQFFSPFVLQTDRPLPGLWRPPPAALLFAQAIKYNLTALERLLEWQASPEFKMNNISDQALSMAIPRLGLKYGVHAPDLVQHAGALSLLSPEQTLEQDNRVSRSWPGPEFDALTLYARDDLYR